MPEYDVIQYFTCQELLQTHVVKILFDYQTLYGEKAADVNFHKNYTTYHLLYYYMFKVLKRCSPKCINKDEIHSGPTQMRFKVDQQG